MRILLDTHCWLWWFNDPGKLSQEATEALADAENEVFISAVSVWEVALKTSLGKLEIVDSLENLMALSLRDQQMRALDVSWRHAQHVISLPMHHRDPFDRLLVAQSQIESLPILTADAQVLAYEVELIWAGRRKRPSK